MYLEYWTICKCFIDKITFSWHTYYTYPTHKCSLNQCHWNFFHSEIFVIFQISVESIFSRNFKIKNFSGTGGYMATGVPLKFFTGATEIFDFDEFNTKYSWENGQNIQNLRRGFLARRPRYFNQNLIKFDGSLNFQRNSEIHFKISSNRYHNHLFKIFV